MTPTDYTALAARLRNEYMALMGYGIERGSVDASISGALACEAADAIDALVAEVARLWEAGQEAAWQVIASDEQAQDALDRALKAEAEVARLRFELDLALKRIEWCAGLIATNNHRDKGFDMAEKTRAALQTESLAADDNHL